MSTEDSGKKPLMHIQGMKNIKKEQGREKYLS